MEEGNLEASGPELATGPTGSRRVQWRNKAELEPAAGFQVPFPEQCLAGHMEAVSGLEKSASWEFPQGRRDRDHPETQDWGQGTRRSQDRTLRGLGSEGRTEGAGVVVSRESPLPAGPQVCQSY